MEARFLASQAERLADNKRRLQKSRRQNQLRSNGDDGGQSSAVKDSYFEDDAPNLCEEDDVNDVDVATSNGHHSSQKEEGHRFWMNFRKLCSELQSQVDVLLLLSPDEEGGAATTADGGDLNNYEAAKAYYSTAARRSEGRTRLDFILDNVRLLRRHCLSSSSVLPSTSKSDNDDTTSNQPLLLSSILTTPMPEMTQTDMRLFSEEIDRLLKCIDEARAIISPKEKFVFKRYRKAMEEKSRLLLGEGANNVSSESQPSEIDDDGDIRKESNVADNDEQDKETFNHDGGVLENKSDCIIEIFADDNIQVNEASKSQIQYYSLPRCINSLHPPAFNNSNNNTQQHQTSSSTSSSGSMSYLLQNLTNVTILLHGSRPTLHIKNIHNCHIYVTEPTLGPVHMTNCHSSQIRCSCYQLRIHDSINVKFGVWVRSGPIIENCKEMVFEGDYYLGDGGHGGVGKKNMYWDVKDFNWLRTLRKSPNFVVVTSEEEESGLKGGELVPDKEGVGANVSDQMPLQEEEEEDSEDEL